MASRCSLHLVFAVLLLASVPSIAAEASADDPYSGTYDVQGMTTDVKSGDTRRIQGHIVLTKKGERWAAASELETDFPTHGGAVRTDVIGTGDGERKGDGLEGEAHTQLVIGTVPGVDTDFAFIPRTVGPRLVSKWKARLEKDGTLVVELTNTPEQGEEYSPTRTTLKGKRVEMPAEAARSGKQPADKSNP